MPACKRHLSAKWVVAAGLGAIFAAWLLTGSSVADEAGSGLLGEHFPSQGHCHIGESCPPRADGYEYYPYNSNPPTSGPHEERFPTTFISDVPLPRRILVHILEHGNVEILYNNSASPELIKKLRDYAMRYDFRFWMLQTPQTPGADVGEQLEGALAVFVAPYPNMPHKIALTAWTRLETLDDYDQDRIDRFVKAWVGNAENVRQ